MTSRMTQVYIIICIILTFLACRGEYSRTRHGTSQQTVRGLQGSQVSIPMDPHSVEALVNAEDLLEAEAQAEEPDQIVFQTISERE